MLDYEALLKKAGMVKAYEGESYRRTIKPFSDSERFLEFVSLRKAPGIEAIMAAYMNALASFEEGTNIANGIGVEFMLFLAHTDQISAAIKSLAPNEGESFVAISNDAKLVLRVSKIAKLKPYAKSVTGNIRDILERMSLSRLQK
ncbi:MAG: hypothetical protein M1544_02880 [Candidatus Marsarchaeota archaeon]|nr:hypothetical protein [Candidatus Marsarchaeota archaeon]MCL5102274.1 hypothetical protein [Candidatus Marsarchaeota archaeon]